MPSITTEAALPDWCTLEPAGPAGPARKGPALDFDPGWVYCAISLMQSPHIARGLAALASLLVITVQPPQARAAKARPDLVVSAVSGPERATTGTTIAAQAGVTNRGKRRAKAAVLTLVLSRDARASADDLPAGSRKAKALKPRKKQRLALKPTVPATAAPGSYVLLACADGARKVKESNERNNCRGAVRRVQVVAATFGPPDPRRPVPTPTPPGPDPTPTPQPGSDITAPITFDDVPSDWSQVPVTVTLTAIDFESGVAATWFTLDGSDPGGATNPARESYDPAAQPVLDHGASIRYLSTDTAGNVEVAHTSATAQVDSVPPSTTDDLPPGHPGSSYPVELTATDDRSGVEATWYTTDGSDPRSSPTRDEYAGEVLLASGSRVRYFSVDVAGNDEPVRQSGVLGATDDLAPVTTDNVPAVYVAQPVRVTLTATDSGGSGLASTHYTLNGSDPADPSNFATAPVRPRRPAAARPRPADPLLVERRGRQCRGGEDLRARAGRRPRSGDHRRRAPDRRARQRHRHPHHDRRPLRRRADLVHDQRLQPGRRGQRRARAVLGRREAGHHGRGAAAVLLDRRRRQQRDAQGVRARRHGGGQRRSPRSWASRRRCPPAR